MVCTALKYNESSNTLQITKCCLYGCTNNRDTLQRVVQCNHGASTPLHTLKITTSAMKILNRIHKDNTGEIKTNIDFIIKKHYLDPNNIVKRQKQFVHLFKSLTTLDEIAQITKPLEDAIIQMGNARNKGLVEDLAFMHILIEKSKQFTQLQNILKNYFQYTSIACDREFRSDIEHNRQLHKMLTPIPILV